jgi:hypothetical protein
MPVAAKVGSVDRHHGVVAGARRNIAVAVGAEVVLVRLVGLQEPYFHFAE